jgi:hypothetical protein
MSESTEIQVEHAKATDQIARLHERLLELRRHL